MQARDGSGHEARERARERTDAQARGIPSGDRRELSIGNQEALSDRVCVSEQDLALGRQPEAAGTALEQLRADLAFEQGDLIGDGRLREGQLARRAGEGSLMGNRAESEHAPRIHRPSLSNRQNDYLTL